MNIRNIADTGIALAQFETPPQVTPAPNG